MGKFGGVKTVAFPSNDQFSPVIVGGQPSFDIVGDESPGSTDLVGNASFLSFYYAYDGTNVYFRLRLNEDPRNNAKTAFQNFAWGALFNTNGVAGTYQWLLAVNGNAARLDLIQNTNIQFNTWNDPAEGTDGKGAPNFSRQIINFDVARVTPANSNFGGNPDFFLDFFIPANTLFSFLGITEITSVQLIGFTSANANNFNKDSLRSLEGFQFISAFSAPASVVDVDVRAELDISKTLVSGPSTVTAGVSAAYTARITVQNTGKSQATTVLVRDVIGLDIVSGFVLVTVGAGSATYNSTTKTLSWSIGNLAAGGTTTLTFTVTGIFTTAGARTLETATVNGIDSFTGNQIPAATATTAITVQATGGIVGNVADRSSGLPLADVAVQLQQGSTTIATTITNGSGDYSFTGIAPGTYTLTFSKANYATLSIPVTVTSGNITRADTLLTPQPGTITGTVTAAGDGPLANATVNLTNTAGVLIAQTTTNASGQYTFSSVSPGHYNVSVIAANFQSSSSGVDVASNGTVTKNFVLQPNPAIVQGTVTDSGGSPLSGVLVEALNETGIVIASTTTNGSGQYMLNNLAPGTYRVRISTPQFITQIIGTTLTAGETATINVALSPNPGALTGTVRDAGNGAPLANASIRIINSHGIAVAQTTTNGAGNYFIDSLAPGSYSVSFSVGGYGSQILGAIIRSDATTTVDANLSRLVGTLSGTVTNVNGIPISGAVIQVFQNNILIASALTDVNGSYTINNLIPGTYSVSSSSPNFSTGVSGALIQANQTTIVNTQLQPNPGTLSGTVTDNNGNLLSGSTVIVRDSSSSTIVSSTVTNNNGGYIVTNLAPGSYSVTASANNFQTNSSGAIINSNQTSIVNFSLSPNPASITGTIRNSITDDPITGASIEIRIVNLSGSTIATAFTDPSGMYLVNNLAPGTYGIIVNAPNFQTNSATVTLSPGETKNVSVSLNPSPGGITGTITDAQAGTPIAGAVIKITDANNVLIQSVLTGSQGNYSVTGLAPGSYNIIVSANGFQTGLTGAVVQAGTITSRDVALEENPGSIIGTVTPAIAGAIIQLFSADNIFIASTSATPEGLFQFNNITPSQYIITASAPNFATSIVGATVLPNQTTSVSITLQPNPATISGQITSSTGQPVKDAIIKILDANETVIGIGSTDINGNYSIGNIPPGTFSVVVTAPNFSTVTSGITLTPGETVSGVNIQLQPDPGSIAGQVIDQNENPINGVTIIVRKGDGSFVTSVLTSPFGNYVVDGLAPGSYTVIANKDNFSTESVGVIVISDQTTAANLTLTSVVGDVSGRVVDLNGNPVTGNNIQVKLLDSSGLVLRSFVAESDGTFSVLGLSAGRYFINISAQDFSANTVPVDVIAGTISSVTIPLTPAPATLTGTVVNQITGEGVPGAILTINSLSGIFIAQRVSGNNGAFTISGLPPTNVVVSASATNFGSDTLAVSLHPNQTSTIVLPISPNPGSLTGFISNAQTGGAIPGTIITIFKSTTGEFVTSVVSDGSGQFLINGLTPGSYRAVASADGFSTDAANFTIEPGNITTLSFALAPNPATLTGTVTDAQTGTSIAGAGVVMVIQGSGIIVASTQTDQTGNYVLTGIAPGSYDAVFSTENFTSQTVSVNLTAGETETVNVALLPNPAVINGTVRDVITGNVLSNALIQVFNGQGRFLASMLTDVNGQYTISGLPEGMLSVQASAPNFASDMQVITLKPGETETVDFALAPNPASLTGSVTDAQTGAPLPGTVIQVFIAGTAVPVKSTFTDPNGLYVINGLNEGEYRVVIGADNYASSIFHIVLGPGEARVLNAALVANPATIQGQVTDAQTGTPIAGAGVVTVIQGSGVIVASIQTDQTGNYVLTGIAPGSYNVVFSAANFTNQTVSVNLTAGETETVNIALTPNPALITGTVRDATTGNVLSNALIQVFNSQGRFLASTLTDVNGQYTISGLPEGMLSVQASAPNFASDMKVITLTPGETGTVDFALASNPASLTGSVTDAQTGAPLSGALVQVLIAGTGVPVKSTLTDPTGLYVINGLAEGEYRVEIGVDNYASSIFRIVLDPGEERVLNAALQANPATIQGQVTDAQTGTPIAGAGVVTVVQGSGVIVASTQTDQTGNYLLTGIAPGSYNVVISTDNFTSQTVSVNLAAGETETVNVALTPNPATINGTVRDSVTGTVLPNALIQVFNSQGRFLASTLTDVNGQYAISGLPEGTISVQASAPNFASELTVITLTPGETETVDFALASNPASLTGSVTDAQTGAPLSGALVQVFIVGTAVPVKFTLTDPNGLYFINGLNGGEYQVVISDDNYVAAIFRIILEPGEERVLDAALQANPATIQGQVT
ncbi:carboxypeptidase regulatory-like domain-containing protein, partial [Bacillus sp. OTU530]|uniref:carboxypeptidase regulatory-like domain-containing protein n=1 Tax=Bacillus sp. OTU530 TaxID=3043862 RepID=UPI00313A7A90